MVRPDASALLRKIAWHYGEPVRRLVGLPTFYLAQFARQHITVALNGDGGDENFGGYTRYVAIMPPWLTNDFRLRSGARLESCRAFFRVAPPPRQ